MFAIIILIWSVKVPQVVSISQCPVWKQNVIREDEQRVSLTGQLVHQQGNEQNGLVLQKATPKKTPLEIFALVPHEYIDKIMVWCHSVSEDSLFLENFLTTILA